MMHVYIQYDITNIMMHLLREILTALESIGHPKGVGYPFLTGRDSKGGGGVWAMAGVQGKVAFGLSHFCIEVFQKKL